MLVLFLKNFLHTCCLSKKIFKNQRESELGEINSRLAKMKNYEDKVDLINKELKRSQAVYLKKNQFADQLKNAMQTIMADNAEEALNDLCEQKQEASPEPKSALRR